MSIIKANPYDRIFSYGYPQFSNDPKIFYTFLKNSHPRYRAEIRDIYFSAPFSYEFNGVKSSFGDVMAASSNVEHYTYLLKIQREFGIPISLTFNETYPDHNLLDNNVLKAFVNYLGGFYEDGVRSCTISNVHMMATGVLQRNFPEMQWKNTVNHIITKPQQVVDYHLLGYNVINLDRSLNRDFDALKAMQPLRKKYPNLVLSLLVTEGCMPNCAFKVEHDTQQKEVGFNYWEYGGQLTCGKWRTGETNELPRVGTDIVWGDSKTFLEYAELVDYFKFTGRLGNLKDNANAENEKFVWSNLAAVKGRKYAYDPRYLNELQEHVYATADCFQDLVENNHGVLHPNWQPGRTIETSHECKSTWDRIPELNKDTIWVTKKGKALNQVLKNCKNECWDCHACERTYGTDDFDSLLEINRDAKELRGHSIHFQGIPIALID